MLRADNISPRPLPPQPSGIKSFRPWSSDQQRSAEIWPERAHVGLADIVRRICTLCGWSRSTEGMGRTLAVTSAVEREGKSTLARAVAMAMAYDHAGKVVQLEADLVRPTLAADCLLQPTPGLSEVLSGEAELDEALRPTGFPNLMVLPAGHARQHASRLLRSSSMSDVLKALQEQFAFIIFDLPAVLRSSDAAVLAEMTDGAIFVVRTGVTSQRDIEGALSLLGGTQVHGVVLNRFRSSMPGFVRRIFAS